jgi:hypothetical protein
MPPYTGQDQQSYIPIMAPSRYQQVMEEGPWMMPPYAQIYPPPTQGPAEVWVPPPIKQIDIFAAQQTWPL